jgi:hypothetical protein
MELTADALRTQYTRTHADHVAELRRAYNAAYVAWDDAVDAHAPAGVVNYLAAQMQAAWQRYVAAAFPEA